MSRLAIRGRTHSSTAVLQQAHSAHLVGDEEGSALGFRLAHDGAGSAPLHGGTWRDKKGHLSIDGELLRVDTGSMLGIRLCSDWRN